MEAVAVALDWLVETEDLMAEDTSYFASKIEETVVI